MRSRCEEQRTQVQTSHTTSSTFWWFFTVSLCITYLLGQTFYYTAVFNMVFFFLMKVHTSCIFFLLVYTHHASHDMWLVGSQAEHWFALQAGWSQQTFSIQNTTWEGLVTFHPHGKAQQWEVKLPPRIRSHEAHSHWMDVFAFFQSEEKAIHLVFTGVWRTNGACV